MKLVALAPTRVCESFQLQQPHTSCASLRITRFSTLTGTDKKKLVSSALCAPLPTTFTSINCPGASPAPAGHRTIRLPGRYLRASAQLFCWACKVRTGTVLCCSHRKPVAHADVPAYCYSSPAQEGPKGSSKQTKRASQPYSCSGCLSPQTCNWGQLQGFTAWPGSHPPAHNTTGARGSLCFSASRPGRGSGFRLPFESSRAEPQRAEGGALPVPSGTFFLVRVT